MQNEEIDCCGIDGSYDHACGRISQDGCNCGGEPVDGSGETAPAHYGAQTRPDENQ